MEEGNYAVDYEPIVSKRERRFFTARKYIRKARQVREKRRQKERVIKWLVILLAARKLPLKS